MLVLCPNCIIVLPSIVITFQATNNRINCSCHLPVEIDKFEIAISNNFSFRLKCKEQRSSAEKRFDVCSESFRNMGKQVRYQLCLTTSPLQNWLDGKPSTHGTHCQQFSSKRYGTSSLYISPSTHLVAETVPMHKKRAHFLFHALLWKPDQRLRLNTRRENAPMRAHLHSHAVQP